MKRLSLNNLRRYGAWTFAGLIILSGSLFVILYGNAYGYIKSVLWLIAFIISFGMSLFLVEPIRLVAFAIVLAAGHRRDNNRATVTPFTTNPLQAFRPVRRCCMAYKQIFNEYVNKKSEKKLVFSKCAANNDKVEWAKDCIYYRELMTDLLMFCLYMAMLLLIVLGSRDSSMFYSGRFAMDCLNGKYFGKMQLEDVTSEKALLRYLTVVLAPTIHQGSY